MCDCKHNVLGKDPHSYGNFDQVIVTHLFPQLTVDFQRKIFYGFTDVTASVLQDGTDHIDLDVKGLCIEKAESLDHPRLGPLLYTKPQHHPALGMCLRIPIPEDKRKKGDVLKLRVSYSTSTELSGGIQWLEPHQTKGKQHPFCYTQFEAALARSFLPCMDTPAVKTPYAIKITVPSPLVAACSGNLIDTVEDGEGFITYHFEQENPIPAYLIACGIGALKRAKVGPRSYVWCEQEYIKAAEYEFAETEDFLQAAEQICGVPYLWKTYDLLVLPAAFPYGGMENPNLTFINSALITGDRSLTDVVAHEIIHSWSGNLVTNSSWSDFFLNEGFTMYIERLVLDVVHTNKHGKVAGEHFRHFHLISGFKELEKTVEELKDHKEFTKLRPNLNGVDPDDAFSRIPYEKGCLMLLYLESLVGGKEKMIGWLHKYFDDFKRQSITADQMKEHFLNYFKDLNLNIDWQHWFYGEGLPQWNPNESYFDQTLNKMTVDLANKWLQQGGVDTAANDLHWDSLQTMVFLDNILTSNTVLSKETVQKMQQTYHFDTNNNVEIVVRWLRICLKSRYMDALPQIENFLANNGRGVYVKTLYSILIQLAQEGVISMDKVKQIYQSNRSFYHSVIRNFLDSKLKY